MAILDACPGLEVRVFVDDKPLHEYNDRYAKVARNASERYIEVATGNEFRIYYSFKPPFPATRSVSTIITIDGRDIDEPVVHPKQLFDPEGHTSAGPVAQVGSRWSLRPYCFASLEIGNMHHVQTHQ